MVRIRGDIQVRPAEENDYGQLCLIDKGTWCRHQAAVFIREMMTISPETVLVAQESDRLFGFLLAICRRGSLPRAGSSGSGGLTGAGERESALR